MRRPGGPRRGGGNPPIRRLSRDLYVLVT